MIIFITIDGETYKGKEVPGGNADERSMDLSCKIPDTAAGRFELHDGSFLVLGKDAFQRAHFVIRK